jgi:L-amino acid N-acyltransferase YncA
MTSAPSLLVRDATEIDLAAIEAIYRPYVLTNLATFEETPPTVDELSRRLATVRALGYCYANTYRARPAYRNTIEDSVYLADGMGGQGIGRALLSTLIDRCAQGGWRQMVAVIGDSANTASVGLHRSLGFEMIGTMPAVGFKLGRWVDTVIMQRPLGPGADMPPEPLTHQLQA